MSGLQNEASSGLPTNISFRLMFRPRTQRRAVSHQADSAALDRCSSYFCPVPRRAARSKLQPEAARDSRRNELQPARRARSQMNALCAVRVPASA